MRAQFNPQAAPLPLENELVQVIRGLDQGMAGTPRAVIALANNESQVRLVLTCYTEAEADHLEDLLHKADFIDLLHETEGVEEMDAIGERLRTWLRSLPNSIEADAIYMHRSYRGKV